MKLVNSDSERTSSAKSSVLINCHQTPDLWWCLNRLPWLWYLVVAGHYISTCWQVVNKMLLTRWKTGAPLSLPGGSTCLTCRHDVHLFRSPLFTLFNLMCSQHVQLFTSLSSTARSPASRTSHLQSVARWHGPSVGDVWGLPVPPCVVLSWDYIAKTIEMCNAWQHVCLLLSLTSKISLEINVIRTWSGDVT